MKLFNRSLLLLSLLIAGITQSTVLVARDLIPYNSETLTIAGTAAGFTSSKITSSDPTATANANVATFTVNCASGTTCILRFTVDGSTPTSSAGLRALYGDTVTVNGHVAIVNFRAIRETGTSVVIDSVYFH